MKYKSRFKKVKETYNKEYGTFEKINEHSLSRVWKHEKRGFILMSAFRGDDFEENMKKHEQLKKDIRALGYGFFEIDGMYQYENGTLGDELSVFIPALSNEEDTFYFMVDNFQKLGKKYNQESILVKEPDSYGGKASLLFCKSGQYDEIGTRVGYDKIAIAYSKLRKGSHKGRTFVIEGIRIPSNHINAMQLQKEKIIF